MPPSNLTPSTAQKGQGGKAYHKESALDAFLSFNVRGIGVLDHASTECPRQRAFFGVDFCPKIWMPDKALVELILSIKTW